MGDGARVLVVEDEELVRGLVTEALSDAGYEVVHAGAGAEALDALEGDPSGFHALVTDVNLGNGPTGWDVGKRAREHSPGIAVVYVTGDSAQDWPANGVPHSQLIAKPFAMAQIVTAVSALLNAVDSSQA